MRYLLIITVLLLSNNLIGQYNGHKIAGIVGFYNLENLFDTEDDPTINDEEFLPSGSYEWDEEKYNNKIANMSRVLKDLHLDVVGVSEIENRKVLEDLVTHPNLASLNYQIIHFDSPDRRGVDVGLLYRPHIFVPFSVSSLPVKDPANSYFLTRDILLVSGILSKMDTLHMLVNHWPSRRGGGGEDKRILAATVARKAFDSLSAINPMAKVIITGDLNDDPRNKSLTKTLNATDKIKDDDQMYNASYPTYRKGYGTLFYRGAYNLFDQIVVSQSLLEDKGESLYYIPDSFTIAIKPYMTETSGPNTGAPLRTHSYGKYLNGYSDHFPVFVVLGKR